MSAGSFSRWSIGGGLVEPDWRPTSNSDTIELGAGGGIIAFTGDPVGAYQAGPHGDRGYKGPSAQDIADGWVFGLIPTSWPDNQPQWIDNLWGVDVKGAVGAPAGTVTRYPIWYRWHRGSVAAAAPAPVVTIPPPDPTPILSSSDSTWGNVIPQSFGTRRIDGAPIWVSAVRRVAEHGNTGAVDFAVAFGTTARAATDPIRLVQLTKLFADGALVYDASGATPVVQSGITVTFYPGLPNAMPDTTILAAAGAAATSAYRDMFYCVIRNFPLDSRATKLPSIRGELVDSPAFAIPSETPVDQLEPGGIDADSLVTDFDTNTVFGFSSRDAEPHFLHSFDLIAGTELSKVEINGDLLNNNPSVDAGTFTYIAVDWWTVYDKYNDLIHFQHGPAISNSMRIASMRADSGLVIASFGRNGNETTSDADGVAFSEYADFFRFRAFGKTIHGLFLGTLVGHEAVVMSYRTLDTQSASPSNAVQLSYAGVLKAGDVLRLAFETKINADAAVQGVCAYPVLDRPELISKYGLDSADSQDGIFLYGSGTQLWCFQGNISGNGPTDSETASWVTTQAVHPVAEFGANLVGAVFVEKNSGCVCVVSNDGTSNSVFTKFQPVFAKSGNSVVLVSLTKLYDTPIVTDNRLFGNMIKNENTDAGTFAYFGTSNTVVVASLATGDEVYRHSVTFTLPSIGAYDSATQTLFMNDTNTSTPVRLGLFGTASTLVDLVDFLRWCALKLGYVDGDVTSDAAITETLIGGNISTPTLARQAMITVAAMFGVASVEIGGKMKFVRPDPGDAATLAAVFTRDDVARMSESELQSIATTTLAANELVANVSVTYLDPANDYKDTTQTYNRVRFPFQTAKGTAATNYSAPIVVSASDALTIAGRLVLTSFAEGTAFEYRLPHRYLNLSPGDIAGFMQNDNLTLDALSQILEITYNADWSMTLKGKRWSLSDTMPLNADLPGGRQAVTAANPSDSVAHALDVPLIAPEDETPGASSIYTGVGSFGQSWWKSATLHRIMDGVTSELYFASNTIPWGVTSTALPACETSNTTFATDNDTVLTVSGRGLTPDMFVSVSEDDFRAGLNACFVGKPGAWELIYFRDVEVVGGTSFKFTGLLRGRRGTNVWCDTHSSGDTVVFAVSNGARAAFRGDRNDPGFRGKTLSYYAVGESTRRAPAANTFAFAGNAQRPWSVRRVRAEPASTVNKVGATSYTNECGSGDRRDLIVISSSYHVITDLLTDGGPVSVFDGPYSVRNLIDGDDGNNSTHATKMFDGQTDVVIIFDFHASGFKQVIDEFTWTQSNSTSIGTYDIEASDDAASWVSLSTAVNLAGSGGIHAFTNTTGYWFYRFRQTGGATSSSPWLKEVTFKTMAHIEDANDLLITWLRRDRLKPSDLWVTDTQPMTEAAELYQVEVSPLVAVTDPTWPKTLDLVTSPRVVYSAALQATHGFTPPLQYIGLRVTQLGQGTDTANRLGLRPADATGVTVGDTP